MKVVIVDYNMGNIKSISSALNYIGADEISVSSEYEELKSADKLILPGVGAFGEAMTQIKEKKLDKYLQELVLIDKKPILGICLGMQLMGTLSNEHGEHTGLNLINGSVSRFEPSTLVIPHIGVNQVKINNSLRLYEGFGKSADFYFLHSYKMVSRHSINSCICNYGNDFIASFEMDNIAGVQYHPELSQRNGLKVLRNFLNNFMQLSA